MKTARLSADDIPHLLPPDQREVAQASVLFRKFLETVPFVGPLASGILECRATGRALEREAEIVRTVNAMWIVIRQLEKRLPDPNIAELSQVAKDVAAQLASAGVPHEVTFVLDSYFGLTATLRIPLREVPPEAIPGDLVTGYASVANNVFDAREVISRANRIRASMSDGTIDQPQRIPHEALGSVERDAREYWYRAFEAARRVDSRMVASLLLALDPAPLSERAKEQHANLLQFLTDPT